MVKEAITVVEVFVKNTNLREPRLVRLVAGPILSSLMCLGLPCICEADISDNLVQNWHGSVLKSFSQ